MENERVSTHVLVDRKPAESESDMWSLHEKMTEEASEFC